ncbi:Hypothetical protein SCLAV_3278 [Streptomyces clavuligerus]|uniref:Uncharacterized protein n=1 Tax=Streptomyces clavuligerus TaxID=1901 RepID=E2PZ18_STRCL|nr:Hypothetical protein SCLAV_3278 [Streptomyces clavuligerus]
MPRSAVARRGRRCPRRYGGGHPVRSGRRVRTIGSVRWPRRSRWLRSPVTDRSVPPC